uniref:Uncharacterized protein n=1 Tax=Phytophthora ramorum TaxID=164328 RepID=H3GBU1_PHYRM
MRMRLITRLTRAPVRSKVPPTSVPEHLPVAKPKEAAYGNGTAWVGLVTTAAALGVAVMMSHETPSSEVECGSSGDSWWTSTKPEQRGHYALLKELGRGGSKGSS